MTEEFKNSIQTLISIQAKDTELDQCRALLDNVPIRIAEIEKNLENEKQSLAVLKQEQAQLQLKRREEELTLSEKENAIRKHQQELNAIKTNEAFKSLLSEIEHAKTEKDILETEILNILEQVDQARLQEKERQKESAEYQKRSDAEIQALKEEQKRLEGEMAQKTDERAQLAQQLSPEILERYEYIRSRRSGLAMVPVQGESCGGCHMELPTHIIVEIKKQGQPVLCESCQRILYLTVPVQPIL